MSASPVGRRLGGFTVEQELGRGGMGLVLLARQESLDRPAVLKKIREDLIAGHSELEARFEREARTAARLHHPNVVAVYDRFQHRGAHYIATEYVDGLDLAGLLEREGALPWRVAAMIGLEVARGLEAIHAEGMLHRDLKPHNLLVGRRGEIKITDFGLVLEANGAQLTQPGIAVGTPPYMAPEQLRGERVDTRADVFAFGCVLYEMLVGRPPFELPEEGEATSLLSRVESGAYPSLRRTARSAPRALRRIVRRCLKPKPARRMVSASEIRIELETLLERSSPIALQHSLSSWLWGRHVFEARVDETVVMLAASGAGGRGLRGLRRAVAAAALIASLAALGYALREPGEVADWSEAVATRIVASD